MDLGENLNNSFEYTKKMTKEGGKWIILAILNIIPIVNLISLGYYAKAVRESPQSEWPPNLEDYGAMLIQGVKIIIVGFIYMIIPTIIFSLGASTLLGAGMLSWSWIWGAGQNQYRWISFPVMGGLFGLLTVLGIVVAFLIAIIATVGIVHMIKHDRIEKAFAFNEIITIIGEIGWGKYVLWLIVIFIISAIFSSIGRIPIIGALIVFGIAPLFFVFIARSVALIYNDSKMGEKVPQPKKTVEKSKEHRKFCTQCGRKIPIEVEYCSYCGSKQ